jgi:hypothetical protein
MAALLKRSGRESKWSFIDFENVLISTAYLWSFSFLFFLIPNEFVDLAAIPFFWLFQTEGKCNSNRGNRCWYRHCRRAERFAGACNIQSATLSWPRVYNLIEVAAGVPLVWIYTWETAVAYLKSTTRSSARRSSRIRQGPDVLALVLHRANYTECGSSGDSLSLSVCIIIHLKFPRKHREINSHGAHKCPAFSAIL